MVKSSKIINKSLTLKPMRNKKGFTLIEVLLVIVIIAILAGIVIIAINPGRQIASANDAQRSSDVKAILDAVHQFSIENRGTLPDGIPTDVAGTISNAGVDICGDLVPTYISAMPFDPTAADAAYTDCTAYNTGYTILNTSGRITVDAPSAEGGAAITITR